MLGLQHNEFGGACGACDVCVSNKGAVKSEAAVSDTARVLEVLADGALHSPAEIEALGMSRARMQVVLRELCDEERVVIEDGKVRKA